MRFIQKFERTRGDSGSPGATGVTEIGLCTVFSAVAELLVIVYVLTDEQF